MYNFESRSLIIYVSRCNRQTLPRDSLSPISPVRSERGFARATYAYASHVYPFNAQFPYNLTLRSKRNFPKSFPAAAGREAVRARRRHRSSRDQMLGQISHSPSLYLKADP